MPYTITATFQSTDYIACHTAFLPAFKSQRDVAGLGFRKDNGNNTIILFPTQGRAMHWGDIWFKINKRTKPSLNKSFFTINEVTLT